MKKVVTISREFGSGGRFIGETLAKELEFTFYDKEIIAQVAEKTGLSEKFIEERGEYAPKKNMFSYSFVGRDAQGTSVDDYIYQVQKKIICDIAEKENCVFAILTKNLSNPNFFASFIFSSAFSLYTTLFAPYTLQAMFLILSFIKMAQFLFLISLAIAAFVKWIEMED